MIVFVNDRFKEGVKSQNYRRGRENIGKLQSDFNVNVRTREREREREMKKKNLFKKKSNKKA